MLDVVKIWSALITKEHFFDDAIAELASSLSIYNQAQITLPTLTLAEIDEKLSLHAWPGASPTKEFETSSSLIIPSTRQWTNHRKNREWAVKTLRAQPTYAVGSAHVYPDRSHPLLTGMIQVGWFENPHLEAGKNIKDSTAEIFAPEELARIEKQRPLIGMQPPLNEVIETNRFVKSIDQLCQYMESKARATPKPICFFDDPFIISFTQHLHPKTQVRYAEAVKKLLATSEKTKVPVISYIEDICARDIIRMLSIVFNLTGEERLNDALLVDSVMGGWGDRSQIFQCSREDPLPDKDFYRQVYFTYLRTSEIMSPARIEFPAWIFEEGQQLYEQGLHNHILDIVRAECVFGPLGSYPSDLETAVSLAALTTSDQKDFQRIVQAFTQARDLELRSPSSIPSRDKQDKNEIA